MNEVPLAFVINFKNGWIIQLSVWGIYFQSEFEITSCSYCNIWMLYICNIILSGAFTILQITWFSILEERYSPPNISFCHPTGVGITRCIEKALAQSGVSKEDVNYINAHATSTPAGDLKEYEALMRCFGRNPDVSKMNLYLLHESPFSNISSLLMFMWSSPYL